MTGAEPEQVLHRLLPTLGVHPVMGETGRLHPLQDREQAGPRNRKRRQRFPRLYVLVIEDSGPLLLIERLESHAILREDRPHPPAGHDLDVGEMGHHFACRPAVGRRAPPPAVLRHGVHEILQPARRARQDRQRVLSRGKTKNPRDVLLGVLTHVPIIRQGAFHYNRVVTGSLHRTAALLYLVVAVAALHADATPPPAPVGGRFARAVLLRGQEISAADLPAALTPADRRRLLDYIERRARFASRRGVIAGEIGLFRRQVDLEREIASLIEQEGIAEEAAAIAHGAPLAIDPTASPSAEAEWAEGILRARPGSAAAPYLYAFLASRYRLVFEQLDGEDRPALERLARKYRTMLERVRHAGDPIFILLAADLDGLATLDPGATRHPGAYLPDT